MENHHAFFMGKSTISMAMFNSYVCLPEGNSHFEKFGSYLTVDLQVGSVNHVTIALVPHIT